MRIPHRIQIHLAVLIIKPEYSSSIRHHGEQGAFPSQTPFPTIS